MGFSRQECWSGLPFPSTVYHTFSRYLQLLSIAGWNAVCFGFPTGGPQWAFKPSLAIRSQSRCGQGLRQRPYWSGWKRGLGTAGTDVGGCPGVEGTPPHCCHWLPWSQSAAWELLSTSGVDKPPRSWLYPGFSTAAGCPSTLFIFLTRSLLYLLATFILFLCPKFPTSGGIFSFEIIKGILSSSYKWDAIVFVFLWLISLSIVPSRDYPCCWKWHDFLIFLWLNSLSLYMYIYMCLCIYIWTCVYICIKCKITFSSFIHLLIDI